MLAESECGHHRLEVISRRKGNREAPCGNVPARGHQAAALRTPDSSRQRSSRDLSVGHLSGITQLAGDAISFGIIGISEIDRSLP